MSDTYTGHVGCEVSFQTNPSTLGRRREPGPGCLGGTKSLQAPWLSRGSKEPRKAGSRQPGRLLTLRGRGDAACPWLVPVSRAAWLLVNLPGDQNRGRHGLAWSLCPRPIGAGGREGDRARRCHVGNRLEGSRSPNWSCRVGWSPHRRSDGRREASVNDSSVHVGAVTGLETGGSLAVKS